MLPFEGSNEVEKFYSQAGQDVFVASVLNGMRDGRFLDIGCNHPQIINNTYLLESKFGWTGIMVDNEEMTNLCKKERISRCVCGDATILDYGTLLKEENFSNIIDYASIDIDGIATFHALQQIPLIEYKIRVITFEHDSYSMESETRELSRKYLEFFGYYRLCSDVKNDGVPYEDWYVHPELVDMERAMAFQSNNKEWRSILFKD